MTELRTIFENVHPEKDKPSADGKRAPRPLTRERVFDAVRRAIVDGSLAPGQRLTERELCETFGISRTVVREVSRMLAAERLADFEAHRGLRVAELTRKRVEEIYQIRTELEAIVVRSFLAAATDADIATARDFGSRMLEAGARGDRMLVVDTMTAFERFMNEVADNQIAAEILGQLNTRISMLRLFAMREEGQIETGMQGVRAIIAGISARDSEAAEQAVRIFVRRSAEAVLRHMDREAA
jgi:DNA-binding GntR family transcriptional regulator